MTEQTVKKEKVQMDPRYIANLTVRLLVTCVIVAALLGIVNMVTEGPIAEINQKKTEEALSRVFQEYSTISSTELTATEEMAQAALDNEGTLSTVYEVQSGGETVGYGVKVVAGGSQGNIEMIVGLDTEGTVTGVSVVDHSETSGIGDRVMNNENGVLDQFVGKSAADGTLAVGTNVDAISGATVSSRGVTKGVNAAIAVVGAMA